MSTLASTRHAVATTHAGLGPYSLNEQTRAQMTNKYVHLRKPILLYSLSPFLRSSADVTLRESFVHQEISHLYSIGVDFPSIDRSISGLPSPLREFAYGCRNYLGTTCHRRRRRLWRYIAIYFNLRRLWRTCQGRLISGGNLSPSGAR